MSKNENPQNKRFYLVSVDLLQGVCLFLMIFGHGLLWWDRSKALNWDTNGIFSVFFVLGIGLMNYPGFLFLYGFNIVNSILRKGNISNRSKLRSRLLRKGIILAMFAFLGQFSMAILTAPDKLLNYLLSWHLFHVFAFSTVFILFIFEIGWYLGGKTNLQDYLEHRQIVTILFVINLSVILVIFLIFHDYSMTKKVPLYVNLDIIKIARFALLDDGQCPMIPWLSFSLVGGLIASFLDLPNVNRGNSIKRAILVLLGGVLALGLGILFLNIEKFTQPAVLYPASSSFMFITIGILTIVIIVLICLIDLDSIYSHTKVNRLLYPFVIISNISLTVFFVHNGFFILDPSLIQSEAIFFLVFTLYWLFFALVAFIWQRWQFKYSLEWIIMKFQNAKFGRSIELTLSSSLLDQLSLSQK